MAEEDPWARYRPLIESGLIRPAKGWNPDVNNLPRYELPEGAPDPLEALLREREEPDWCDREFGETEQDRPES